ncbi:helix-turn-helix domain-containing protein [Pedococcus bigeumensis]|uniref:helix-turn-helix domain-containing protein n=1 Tax=Pedococcus bigeumensis TaxID=433644 RepID=UPI002FE84CF8
MSSSSPVPRLYTIAEVAELTKMSEYWLREQCRNATLAHHRFGRCYRFSDTDLTQLLAGTRVEPQERRLTPTRHRRG